MTTIRVGDRVKDIVTGFAGIAIGRTEWLNKCVRILVQPEKLHEGKVVQSEQFDEEQLVLVKAGAVNLHKERQTGGPKDFTPSVPAVRR
jgi:hypothetical protein